MDLKNTNSDNDDINNFIYNTRISIVNVHKEFFDYLKSIEKKDFHPYDIYDFIKEKYKRIIWGSTMEWIPYTRIRNFQKIAQGGFGNIYQAIWLDGGRRSINDYRIENETVAIKIPFNSQKVDESFLNEVIIFLFS